MAYVHRTVTLTGSAQQLIAGLNTDAAANIPIREITFQADGGNGAAVLVGGSNSVSTSDWGLSIPAGAAGVPAAPLKLGPYAWSGPMKLGDFWVIGTADQKLHVSYVPF